MSNNKPILLTKEGYEEIKDEKQKEEMIRK